MNLHSILIVAVVAVVTIALRFLPFLIFGGKKKIPETILYLGKVLPYAIMGMLVIYCLRSFSMADMEMGIAQIFSCGVVILLHLWKRNTLFSIVGGTVIYMILIQAVFS